MKKYILFIIAALAAAQPLSAQNYEVRDKSFWLDLQVVQHVGLNNWSNVGYVNDALPRTSVTEFRGVLHCNPATVSWLNIYAELGLNLMPAPKMKMSDVGLLPMPHSGTRYYIRDMISESGNDRTSASFRLGAGLLGEFRVAERLWFMPYLGVGTMSMSPRSYEVILKEEGSNMQYRTNYKWGINDNDYDYGGDEMLGFMSGRLNFRYKLNGVSSLVFGLEYTHFFDSVNFYARYANTFNGNIKGKFREKGNKMNMLGLSVGISFR